MGSFKRKLLSDDDEYPEPSLPSSDNNTESDEDCGVGPKKKQALGTEVVESKSTPVKKEALASDDVKCNTSPVSNVFDIGGKKKVTVSQFKGRKLVDIREFYTDSSGVEKPGKKGISVNEDQWKLIVSNASAISEALKHL